MFTESFDFSREVSSLLRYCSFCQKYALMVEIGRHYQCMECWGPDYPEQDSPRGLTGDIKGESEIYIGEK